MTGAMAGVASAGLEAKSVAVKLWVDDAGLESLSATVDLALDAAWDASPIRTQDILISVVDGPKPDNASMGGLDGVDLAPVAAALDLEATISRDVMIVTSATLTDRYGAWQDPADD